MFTILCGVLREYLQTHGKQAHKHARRSIVHRESSFSIVKFALVWTPNAVESTIPTTIIPVAAPSMRLSRSPRMYGASTWFMTTDAVQQQPN